LRFAVCGLGFAVSGLRFAVWGLRSDGDEEYRPTAGELKADAAADREDDAVGFFEVDDASDGDDDDDEDDDDGDGDVEMGGDGGSEFADVRAAIRSARQKTAAAASSSSAGSARSAHSMRRRRASGASAAVEPSPRLLPGDCYDLEKLTAGAVAESSRWSGVRRLEALWLAHVAASAPGSAVFSIPISAAASSSSSSAAAGAGSLLGYV
jgi:hypothetical protein